MRSLAEIQKAIAAHKEGRPEPKGGWVSKLDAQDYTAYMKLLDGWRDGLSHLEMELAIAERAQVVVFITPPIEAKTLSCAKAPRIAPEPPKDPKVLLSEMQRREKKLTAEFKAGDRGAYLQIRNLRSGINMRRERLGLPCLQFQPLPRGQAGRRPRQTQRNST